MTTLKAILLFVFGPVEQAVIGFLSSHEILQLAIRFGILVLAYFGLYLFGMFSIFSAAIVALALASISQVLAGKVALWLTPAATPAVVVDSGVSATAVVEEKPVAPVVQSAGIPLHTSPVPAAQAPGASNFHG